MYTVLPPAEASQEVVFPCLGADLGSGNVILLAEWDIDPYSPQKQQDEADVWDDIRSMKGILPEAGSPVLYHSGRGYHAVWPHPVSKTDARTALQLLSKAMYRGYADINQGGYGIGSICGGFYRLTEAYGGRIRVGRKPGRGKDIIRITRSRRGDTEPITVHDAMVKHYNHRGRDYAYQISHQEV